MPVVIRLKVMPESPEEDLEKIKKSVAKVLESLNTRVHETVQEDIGFGISALIFTFSWPEDKDPEILEEKMKKIKGVSSATVIDVRRVFG